MGIQPITSTSTSDSPKPLTTNGAISDSGNRAKENACRHCTAAMTQARKSVSGQAKSKSITARVVAATNRDLEKEVEAGRFRQDLFYRLNVHTLRVPALRERLADVPALVEHLLASIAAQLRVRAKAIEPDAVSLLASYDWRKNNVRELRNCLERMLIASDAAVIGVDDVPPEIRAEDRDDAADVEARPGTLKALKAQAERRIVLAALEQHDWHVTQAAEALGLADHSSLLKIMRRHSLVRPT